VDRHNPPARRALPERYSAAATSPRKGTHADTRNQMKKDEPLSLPMIPPASPNEKAMTR
jgi:hypothetical protein